MSTNWDNVFIESDIGPAELLRNARLYNAAPKLLEALRDTATALGNYYRGSDKPNSYTVGVLARAKAAITEAETK